MSVGKSASILTVVAVADSFGTLKVTSAYESAEATLGETVTCADVASGAARAKSSPAPAATESFAKDLMVFLSTARVRGKAVRGGAQVRDEVACAEGQALSANGGPRCRMGDSIRSGYKTSKLSLVDVARALIVGCSGSDVIRQNMLIIARRPSANTPSTVRSP